MRGLMTFVLAVMLAAAPAITFAAEKMEKSTMDAVTGGAKKAVDATVDTVKENPGKSGAVVGCAVAIAFFPPALLVCGAVAAAGIGADVYNK